MAKKKDKKEEIKELVTNCDNPQLEIINYDIKII
jgi:hypothetical protein